MNRRVLNMLVVLTASMVVNVMLAQPVQSPGLEADQEIGIPFLQSFEPDEYNASNQNWAIVEDSLGLIYIANGRGLMIYNGETFDLLGMPHGNSVRALAIDEQDRIYYGGSGYFGYIAHAPDGAIQLVNLLDSSDVNSDEFSMIAQIILTPEGVFFRSPEVLFLWQNGKMKTWKAGADRFLTAGLVRDQFYIARKNLGICRMNEDNEMLPLSNDLVLNGASITTILPYGEDQVLIGTADGLHIWADSQLAGLPSLASTFVADGRLYSAIQLRDGTYALCTLNDGLIVMDAKGVVLMHMDVNNGLPSNSVYSVLQDSRGFIWIATSTGLALMEYPSPFTAFHIGEKTPTISAMLRYRGQLIVGTFNGLYRLEQSDFPPAQLVPFLDVRERIWDLLVVGDDLFIAGEQALYIYKNDHLDRIPAMTRISDIHRSVVDSNRVFVGSIRGLEAFYLKNETWTRESLDFEIPDGVYHIDEQNDGTLWLDVHRPWIYKASFSETDALTVSDATVAKLDTAAGLPNVRGYMMLYQDTVYYVDNAELRMLRYDEVNEGFMTYSADDAPIATVSDHLVIAHGDDDQNKWIVEFENEEITRTLLAKFNDEAYRFIELDESRIYDLMGRCFYSENNIIWHGGDDQLIRNDISKNSEQKIFNTIIGAVYYQNDSVIGHGPYRSFSPEFAHSNNSFRFTYGNTANLANESLEYQYLLEGYSAGWSYWSSEAQRDFTNLSEGTYLFKVRSRTVSGVYGTEDVFKFDISAPWHRTWWAYALYLCTGILCAGAFAYWRFSRHRKEKLELQIIVATRTAELQVRNDQLELQKLKLGEQTAALKEMGDFKSRLFANISHEFRTPLTLIKGPLDRLQRFPGSQLSADQVQMMERNSNRLLRLVNQILDLSKLDAKDLPLNLAEGNVFKSMRATASSFSSHAADRNLDYQIKIPATQLWAAFDRDKLEKVIFNLLGNAFKFTRDTGSIQFIANYDSSQLHLEVSDTGQGIASKNLARIFDRFYQVDDSDTKEEQGSGVGLALVKELVDLMGGTINVESSLGKGTTFFVALPLEQLTTETTKEAAFLNRVGQALPLVALADQGVDRSGPVNVPTILVVEDNPDMRAYICEHLERSYKILEGHDGPMGLELALDKTPDLVITDLMMPKMDGLELCSILKSDIRTSHIPIVMLTAKAGMQHKLTGLEKGADVYLTKPFYADELLVQIKRLIESRMKLRTLFSQVSFDPKDLKLPKLDQQFVQQVLDILEEKHDSSDFGVPEMQQLVGMSKTQLHRKMKALTDLAPGAFIRNFRLKRAAQMLIQGEQVTQVAYGVGFNNLSYFAKCFRALHGVSPKAYADQHR